MWTYKDLTKLILVVFCASSVASQESPVRFRVIRLWRHINFTWPDDNSYNTAVSSGGYVPQNNIIAGLKSFDGFYYITLPRMKPGVPATLARIPMGMGMGVQHNTAPALEPYPSWEMNIQGDCNALQNVQNVEIDTVGNLWIIDGGHVNTLSPNPVFKCKPKLVVYSIRLNKTTTVYSFPEEVAMMNGSYLYDIVVDNTDGGYAYITDNSQRDPGIIVFSLKDNTSWKIRHTASMFADTAASEFRVGDVRIPSGINIAGIALGPKIHTSNQHITINEDREVFYSPLSSLHLYSINTTILRNRDIARDGEYRGDVKDYGIKASQSVGMIMDNQGNLYYSLLGSSSIAKWDSHTSFQSGQKVLVKDEVFLQWPNSFAFEQNGNLTVLVNGLNRFVFGNLNISENNFGLVTAAVGGKSYLYDEDFTYDTESRRPVDKNQDEAQYFNPPVSSDQDPYMVPKPDLPMTTPTTSTENHPMHSSTENLMQNDQPAIVPTGAPHEITTASKANGGFARNYALIYYVLFTAMVFAKLI